MQHILRFALALCLALSTLQAFAHEWVTERSWVEDPTGTMTLAQVQQAPQQPFKSQFFGQGFSDSVFWIRLHIDPNPARENSVNDRLIVRIRPPLMDQIEVFDPLDPRVRAAGTLYPWSQDEYRSLNLNFVIPQGQVPRDVWLRLKTSKSTLILVEVMNEQDVVAADRKQEMLFMLYFAVLFICMGWGILSWFENRDPLIRAYVIRELLTLVYGFAILGYNRILFSDIMSPMAFERMNNILILLPIAAFVWFDHQFLKAFKPNKWLLTVMAIIPGIIFIEVGLILIGQSPLAFRTSSVFVACAIILILLTVFSTTSFVESDAPDAKPVIPKLFLRLAYSVSLGSAIYSRLPHMGVSEGGSLVLYLQLIYPLTTSLAIVLLLQVRAVRLGQRQAAAEIHLAVAKVETEQERSKSLEQTNFLRMLTHELKTPLSILRLITDSTLKDHKLGPRASEAVTNIDGIINRCIAVDKASVGETISSYTVVDVNALIENCINAAEISKRVVFKPLHSVQITTDQTHLTTILLNLMDNARKYADESSIEINSAIDTVGDDTVWCFSISNDTGRCGQPDANRVFEKYYRHDAATRESGSGLGLFLVKTLVEKLGGMIVYEPGDHRVTMRVTLSAVPTRFIQ